MLSKQYDEHCISVISLILLHLFVLVIIQETINAILPLLWLVVA